MKVTMDIEGSEAVIQMLTDFSDELIPRVAKGMKQGQESVVTDAKKLCPVDTGELRNSIHSEVREYASFAIGEVTATKEYAVYVEMGTGDVGRASGGNGSGKSINYRTGGWFVPLGRSEQMIADTIVEAASNGFWTYGQPARPFLYPAFKANKNKIVAAIRKAVIS